jgi:hypothetical protein
MALPSFGGPVKPGQNVYHTKSQGKVSRNKKKGKARGGGGLSNLGGSVDILAEAIERQAATQKQQAAQQSSLTSIDPFTALQQQLFSAVNGIGFAPTPLEQLRKMAESQVSAQFDPQISALQGEMDRHSKRGKENAKTARDMYGSLAKDFLAELPAMTEQFAAEDAAANQRYDQSQQQMQGEYDKQAAEQNAVLKRLGIQAAAPDASQQAMEDQAYFQNQSEMDQQSALSALNEQQQAQTNYQQNLGSNARMAGENAAQDIRAMLQDYLGQAGTQLAGLQGQKSSAIEALLAQMQQQDQQNIAKQRQQEFENQMALYNFQLNTMKAANSGQGGGSANDPFGGGLSTGLAGAQNYLASQYPDQDILASNLMEQINDVLSNKQVTQGKFVLEPGNEALGKSPKYSDVGQEYMMDLLRREFEKEGDRYSTGDINATMNALLAYLGKLR